MGAIAGMARSYKGVLCWLLSRSGADLSERARPATGLSVDPGMATEHERRMVWSVAIPIDGGARDSMGIASSPILQKCSLVATVEGGSRAGSLLQGVRASHSDSGHQAGNSTFATSP
jgi:hypothetical protein